MTEQTQRNIHKNVYEAISAVASELAEVGISKTRTNALQNYKFRGIDEVYNAVSSMLVKNRLVITPHVANHSLEQYTTTKGAVAFRALVTVDYRFTLTCSTESFIVCRVVGEANDTSDKATNKAMSAAYKYLFLQTFCIPTEGDNDADASHVELKAKVSAPTQAEPVLDPASFLPAAKVQNIIKFLEKHQIPIADVLKEFSVDGIEKITNGQSAALATYLKSKITVAHNE